MKRFFFLLTACTVALCASASNRYVSPTGNDGDGKSWANAKTTIAGAIWDVGVGDTMFIAEGVYEERLSAQDGATYLGGYNAETGMRDIEAFATILDGTNLGTGDRLVTKYDNPPTNPILIDGLVLQNNNFTYEGGAVNIRANMTLSNCVIRDCEGSSGGAIYVVGGGGAQPIIRNCTITSCTARSSYGGAIYNKGGLIDHCVIELCTSKSHGGAIYNQENGVVENTIIRGCGGKYGVISNKDSCIVRNCVLYNNAATVSGWPDAGGVYVPDGNKSQIINCTFANNYGSQYAGSYIGGGTVYNNVFWGNKAPDSFTEHVNYISSSATIGNNVTDDGSSSKFMSVTLNKNNTAEDGPNFRNPTTFVGIPTNANEITIMRQADFSLTASSTALLGKADQDKAPAKDLDGVVRPIGDGVDIGAYEFDPNAKVVAVTGVKIIPASLTMSVGSKGTLLAQVEPADANNKHVTWSIEDETIATMDKGKVTGVKEGITKAWVETEDGGFKDSAVIEVIPVKYPKEVLEAEATYLIENYSIPSFIPFLVAKQEAKIDSVDPETTPEMIASIADKLQVMYARIAELQPKETPYNQIATIYGDPATHMGFCWFTNGGIKEGKVQLLAKANATADDFATIDGVITVSAQTTDATLHYTPIQGSESPKYDICTAAGLPRNTKFNYISHKAQATNLQPGTVYSWRVGYDGHWSDIAQFVTKDANQGNFSFLYMTDSHIQDYEYIEHARQCAEAVVKNEAGDPNVKFCLFPGDFADTGGSTNSEWQWEQWFEGSMRPALNKMAFVPTDGNHDDSPSLNYDYHFNTDWGFANAASVKPQFKGITYSFVYGDVLFLVFSMQDWWREHGAKEEIMHSDYLTNDVGNWFKEQIAKYPNTKYRVTLSHKNIFSGAGHHEDDECALLREMMLPIFKECEIDLAIQGHDHCYEVMGPVDPVTRAVVPGSVTDTVRVAPEAEGRWDRSSNKTGLEGGTFVTEGGTLYFIGATCGRKRYEPYNRYVMDTAYVADLTDPKLFDNHHHNVKNLFDLFTSKFGQPGAPSYTRFNVTGDGIEMITYKTDADGNKEVYNTINVKRTKPHSVPTGFDEVQPQGNVRDGEKFIRNGQLYIKKDGMIYNVIGQKIAQ